jgi:GntR family transcriptional regulator, rspAB operon transcriptional repressor
MPKHVRDSPDTTSRTSAAPSDSAHDPTAMAVRLVSRPMPDSGGPYISNISHMNHLAANDDSNAFAAGLVLEHKPESLTDVVYEAIRDAIINRVIPPGSRLTEAALAAQLNVSKTPVREALLKLRQIGLVEPSGRRGGRVTLPSRSLIQDAYEARRALESFAAGIVAERGSDEDIKLIREAAAHCLAAAEAGDRAGFRRWDLRFHETVGEATGNPRLRELMNDSFAVVMALRRRDVPQAEGSVACARAHVRIAKAIARRDPDAARKAMRAHVHQVEGYVLASLDEESLGPGAGSSAAS